MSTGSKKWLFSLTALYAIGISTSMAAMESVSGLLAICAMVILVRRGKSALPKDDVALFTVGLILAIFLSLSVGPVRPILWDRVLGMVKNLILFLILRQALSELSIDQRKRLGWFALGTSSVVGWIALSQHLTCHDYFRGRLIAGGIVNGESDCRALGLFSSSMTYGHSVVLPAAILAGLVFVGERPHWRGVVSAGGVWAGLFGCFQRGPWVGFLAAMAFVASQLTRRVMVPLLGVGFAGAGLVLFYSVQLRSRLLSVLSMQAVSNRERLDLWKANLEIFKDHPILGVGFSHNDKLLPDYFQRLGIENGFVSHAHNNVVDFLAGTGVLGVACYLGLIAVICYRSYRASGWAKPWRVGFVAMQIALFVAGLTECNFKDGEVTHQFVFWTALALAGSP